MPAKSGVTNISWIGTWGNGSQWNIGLGGGWSSVLVLIVWAVDLDLFCPDSLHGWCVPGRAIFTEETKNLALVICKIVTLYLNSLKMPIYVNFMPMFVNSNQFHAKFMSILGQYFPIQINFTPILWDTDLYQLYANFTNSYQFYAKFKTIPILDKTPANFFEPYSGGRYPETIARTPDVIFHTQRQ